MKRMLGHPDKLEVIGAARTEASAKQVTEKTGGKCVVCDLTKAEAAAQAMDGIDILVVLSSATPKPDYCKMVGVMCSKICNKNVNMGTAFGYKPGAFPKDVDWEGGKAAIDAAKVAKVKHVIYVGSMGGTDPDHFLNKMGGGNILLYKRKAEIYLVNSGLSCTIIHPGGLLPHFGSKLVPGGERELLVGVNDSLMKGPTERRCIPRDDLAEVVTQCALEPVHAIFDLASKDPVKCKDENKVWDRNLKTLLATIANEKYDYSEPKHEILGN